MLPFGGAHVALGRDPDEVPEVEETTQTFEEGHADAHGHERSRPRPSATKSRLNLFDARGRACPREHTP